MYDYRKSIAQWFKDIAIIKYDKDLKNIKTYYAGLYDLSRSCQRRNSDGRYDKDDTALARVASNLWIAALKNTALPLWILTKVLQRARLDKDGVSSERAALIKIILNRNNKGGGFVITENIMEEAADSLRLWRDIRQARKHTIFCFIREKCWIRE